MDDFTRKVAALFRSGQVESLRIEAVLKPPQPPSPPPAYSPVITLAFGPEFDPEESNGQ